MKWARFLRAKPQRKTMTISELSDIPGVDEATVRAFFGSTHEKSRRMPLLIAAHVASRYQDKLTQPGRMDALQLAEIRGALKAIRLFATFYRNGVDEWLKKSGAGNAEA